MNRILSMDLCFKLFGIKTRKHTTFKLIFVVVKVGLFPSSDQGRPVYMNSITGLAFPKVSKDQTPLILPQ